MKTKKGCAHTEDFQREAAKFPGKQGAIIVQAQAERQA